MEVGMHSSKIRQDGEPSGTHHRSPVTRLKLELHGDCAVIRRAQQADLEGVRTCLSDAFAAFRDAYTPAAYADTVPDLANLQRRLQTMAVFVAEISARIVGTVGVSTSHATEAHLRGMAVVASAQRKGVAQQLFTAAIDHCRSAGCTRVTLDTTAPLRAAIRFYEKNGFRATGRVADFFGMELFEYDLALDDRRAE
jgi:ribosomal protein S18 acetylase RimI-like enzyme